MELADEPNLCTSLSKGRAGVRCDEISQYHTSDLLLAFSFNISLAKKFCDHHTPDMKSLASMIRLESIHFLKIYMFYSVSVLIQVTNYTFLIKYLYKLFSKIMF